MYQKSAVLFISASMAASTVLLGAQTQTPRSTLPPTPAAAGHTDSAHSADADHSFVTAAAMDGMAEVELGRLATNQASNDRIKAFGQHMVADHNKAGHELKTLAASKQITVATSVDAEHQASRDRLAKLSGAEFDRAYVTDMVAGHKKAVADFTRESTSGQDSDVKTWAAKTLPTLRDHLRMIEALQKEVVPAHATSSR